LFNYQLTKMAAHLMYIRANATRPLALFFVLQVAVGTTDLYARNKFFSPPATISRDTSEEKIDYIERIYFSGKKKDELHVMILTTLQDLEGAQATTSVAKQYAFLNGIKDRAHGCETACGILEILAAGAYALDAKEAEEQHVLPPGDEAKGQAGDALQNINSTFGNLNSSLGSTAYDSYVLSQGKVNVFGAANTVSTIAGTANTVVASVSAGTQMLNTGKKLWNQIGGGGGACKKVSAKIIPIGKHEIQQQGAPQQQAQAQQKKVDPEIKTSEASTTIISIPGISTSALRSLTDAVETRPGVQGVARNYNETLSTITVTHLGSTNDLADWIEDKFGTKYKLVGYSAGKINMAPKGK
jgi:hypothetical protein